MIHIESAGKTSLVKNPRMAEGWPPRIIMCFQGKDAWPAPRLGPGLGTETQMQIVNRLFWLNIFSYSDLSILNDAGAIFHHFSYFCKVKNLNGIPK